ncbi:MAG: protein adenylyltransferase SelO family protein, partial [Gammaproteobacteria bacterium]
MKTLSWQNRWLNASKAFYQRVEPTPLAAPYFIHCNERAAELMGLTPGQWQGQSTLSCLNGEYLAEGMEPVATVYAGHQFGIYTTKLGDGRAIVLGEVQGQDGTGYEIQLKGAGLTPYSRTLDGRLPLASAIREYLCGEALAALGIPSSRGLCLLGSGTVIQRERQETAAILVRMSRSYIRFGHFEYFHHSDDFDALREFFVFIIEQHFPELLNEPAENRPLRFLERVIQRTARLVAEWQSQGFTHGVMNTDNMTVSGEALDLDQFGFMEAYDPTFTPNPGDDQNRYQFDQQPDIGRWNCLALAQAFSSLLPRPTVPAGLLRLYRQSYQQHYLHRMRAKLGLITQHEGDRELVNGLLSILTRTGTDYPSFFRQLCDYEPVKWGNKQDYRPLLRTWLEVYRER